MNWEIVVGLTTLLTAFTTVLGIVVKVNRTLVMLEEAVKQLKNCMEAQAKKSTVLDKKLADHDRRIMCLEGKVEVMLVGKRTRQARAEAEAAEAKEK